LHEDLADPSGRGMNDDERPGPDIVQPRQQHVGCYPLEKSRGRNVRADTDRERNRQFGW